ncbi:lipid droplet-associated hydrolase-like [Onthophagus taurus]|uniref:lipid droplet-associated hydrolase-like n=1 Tax=Onthophagus taurus TaxID=166361 RepID=UPI000C20B415|nr:lipid droplet-associated hydrolase-like [Onthophagus taurus]
MQRDYLSINNVPTRILTWGKTLLDDFDETDELIVVISGNPGITEFYIEFLDQLHAKTNASIWILSHAGHEIVDKNNVPSRQGNKKVYDLEGQIKHKRIFIEKYVLPKGIKFNLIGHSIGAYIILELLKNETINSKVHHNYLLFPTIEYMAETPNGVFIMSILRPLKFLLLPLIYFIYILPMFIKIFLISLYIKFADIPKRFINIVLEFVHPYTFQNFCDMGMDEMYTVRARNDDIIKANLEKITLYYGKSDCWVPISYYDKIKKEIYGINAQLCDKNYKHAFVLHDSIEMGDLVGEWIQKNKTN